MLFILRPKLAQPTAASINAKKMILEINTHHSSRDNGIGIPPEEQEKVFEKFHQVENSFTGQVPGAGLGLALCKKVLEAMGGKISLRSEIGKGTDVTLAFPGKPKKRPVAC
jgi:signal transduction histidine kinase